MRLRHLHALALFVAVSTALTAGPALAARPATRAPLISVNWTYGPSSPFAGTRFDGAYVKDQGRVYFLGFRDINNLTDGSVWYLDVASGTYTDTGVDMPVAVSNYGIAALTDNNGLGLYIFGGRTDTPEAVTTVQAYYPATNTTKSFNQDPWPGTTQSGCVTLPAMGVATMSNKAYVLGGLGFSSLGCQDENSAQTWQFDPMAANGSKWTQQPDLNVARGYITPAQLGNKIYAIGGDQNEAGSLVAVSTVEYFKPGSTGWKDGKVADLLEPCDESQAFTPKKGAAAGLIVLAGCGQWPNAVADTLAYDPATDTWAVVGTLNDNRRNHAGAQIGGKKMYILGGYGEASGFIDPIDSSENGKGAASAGSAARPGTPARSGRSGTPTTN